MSGLGDLSQLDIQAMDGGVEIALKVVPGASRTKLVGVLGTQLKVAVAAAPEAGKANAAVVGLLAATFGVKRGDVRIVSGHANPQKRVHVAGLTRAQALARLRSAK